jgi:hypothetical protein
LRRMVCAVVVLGVLAAGACGDDEPAAKGVSGKNIGALTEEALPSELMGLEVTKEDISDALSEAKGSYVRGAALYAFRTDALLQATLQVSRFSGEADPKSAKFRNALINQIGAQRAQQVRVGEDNVYLTRGNQQRIAVWFDDEFFYVLSTREDFAKPRGLLREVLELKR